MGAILQNLLSKKLVGAYGAYATILTVVSMVAPLTLPIIGIAIGGAAVVGVAQVVMQAKIDIEKVKAGQVITPEPPSE